MAEDAFESGNIEVRPNRDTDGYLVCPRCGEETLHHDAVTVFDRPEDARTVVKTHVANGVVSVDAAASGAGNPSLRRDGIVIDMSCEACGDGIQLRLAQHKGATVISWRVTAEG